MSDRVSTGNLVANNITIGMLSEQPVTPAGTRPRLARVIEDRQTAGISDPLIVGSIIGRVSAYTRKMTEDRKTKEQRENLALEGVFEAVRYNDGQIMQASTLYLPAQFMKAICAELDHTNGAAILLNLEIGVAYSKEPVGYAFRVFDLGSKRQTDPMAEIRKALGVTAPAKGQVVAPALLGSSTGSTAQLDMQALPDHDPETGEILSDAARMSDLAAENAAREMGEEGPAQLVIVPDADVAEAAGAWLGDAVEPVVKAKRKHG